MSRGELIIVITGGMCVLASGVVAAANEMERRQPAMSWAKHLTFVLLAPATYLAFLALAPILSAVYVAEFWRDLGRRASMRVSSDGAKRIPVERVSDR